jgi:hypothetical protein
MDERGDGRERKEEKRMGDGRVERDERKKQVQYGSSSSS